jgi:hypothetical protein
MKLLCQIGVHLKADAPLFNERDDLLRRGSPKQKQGYIIGAQGLIRCRSQEGE